MSSDKYKSIEIKRIPESLIELRKELLHPAHTEIYSAVIKEPTFEGSLATIGEKLNILLDGDYDPDMLFTRLLTALRQKRSGIVGIYLS